MAAPAWTGFTFTSKLHSFPSASLSPSLQKLPSPFVAVVIGGSRNIGAATAKALAQAGATGLVITSTSETAALLDTKKHVEAAGTSPKLKVNVLAADVSDPRSAKLIVDVINTSHGGRLDVLINNAAIVSADETAFNALDAVNVENFSKTMDINYVGRFATTSSLLPLLMQTKGTLVNITSAMAHFAGRDSVGYNISALANLRLTEAVAEAYAHQGILAYSVHPGVVATMPRPIGLPDRLREGAVDDVTLCGAFVVWLVKERRGWLSGRYLSANWDVEELLLKEKEIVKGDLLKMRMTV